LSSRPVSGIIRAVELRHLRYFVCVADELHFTRAARRLRVAQPALSRQIRQLEDEIGVALFERGRGGVRLTPAGTAFLEEARSVLERSEQAIRTAQASGAARPAPLDVGYVWGLFHSLVPPFIERFRRLAPEAAVNLFDQTATQQALALAEGHLDVGFIGLAAEADAAGLAHRRIGACSFVAALPLGHPAARRRALDLPALASSMFLAISESTYPGAARLVADACARAGFRPRIVQAADRGHTLLSLVAGNCGVALVPESLAALPHPGVVLRPLLDPPRADLVVAWQPRRPHPLRDAFLASLEPST
jgi:DNA-binding transcriptional LysR family regulator